MTDCLFERGFYVAAALSCIGSATALSPQARLLRQAFQHFIVVLADGTQAAADAVAARDVGDELASQLQ